MSFYGCYDITQNTYQYQQKVARAEELSVTWQRLNIPFNVWSRIRDAETIQQAKHILAEYERTQ